MSLMMSSGTEDGTPLVQMDFFSATSCADEHAAADTSAATPVRSREREPEISFPDPQDTQLVLLPYEPCNDEEFSDDDIVAFHEEAIRHALHSLADRRASPVMRQRVIDWVCAPIVHARRLNDLLSFQAMCCAAGYDAEFLQEYIVRRFAPERLRALGLSQ